VSELHIYPIDNINNSNEAPKGFQSWMEVKGLKVTVHPNKHTHTYTNRSPIILLPGRCSGLRGLIGQTAAVVGDVSPTTAHHIPRWKRPTTSSKTKDGNTTENRLKR